MIALDTSALMAILLDEATAEPCKAVLEEEADVVISAGTLAEALIVARSRGLEEAMKLLLDGIDPTVIPVTAAEAGRVSEAHARWGRGSHPAKLNFGDCFAYAVAIQHGCPLLFVGDDFARTDVVPALPG